MYHFKTCEGKSFCIHLTHYVCEAWQTYTQIQIQTYIHIKINRRETNYHFSNDYIGYKYAHTLFYIHISIAYSNSNNNTYISNTHIFANQRVNICCWMPRKKNEMELLATAKTAMASTTPTPTTASVDAFALFSVHQLIKKNKSN